MQGVNVFENGIGFLARCLGLYTSGTGYFVMYILALIVLVLFGTVKDKKLFLPQAVMLVLTVFNPLFPLILDRIFDVNSEYYRFFWIAPVVVLVPYILTFVIFSAPSVKRPVIAVCVAAMFVIGGRFVYAEGLSIAENMYKIPDELISISRIIHEDSDREYTKAFFEYEYNMEIRQYDPRMLLAVDREDYLYAVSYSYTDEMLEDENKPVYRLLAPLVRNQHVDEEDFTDALEKTQTEYVVLMKQHPQTEFVKRAGLYEIGQTSGHIVYRYDPVEEHEYALIDYSDVPHKFSVRRLK